MNEFDLRSSPWIRVLRDGRSAEVSLEEALVLAHEIQDLDWASPLEAVAVFRQVLLAVYIASTGVPESNDEWAERWNAGSIDERAIRDYLAPRGEVFDLFDSERPFAQVAGLRTANDETKSTAMILAAVASGNNVPIFSSRTDDDPPVLSASQATRALLSAHCFDTAAIKSGAVGDPKVRAGKTTGNPTGAVGRLGLVVPVGESLFHTIQLNTPIIRQGLGAEDQPQWDRGPASAAWEVRPARGVLDQLTWQSRRIRLVPVAWGQDGRGQVDQVVLTAGDRLVPLEPQYELHTKWRVEAKPKRGVDPVRPARHTPGRAAWRGMEALLPAADISEGITTSQLVSQIGNLVNEGVVPALARVSLLNVGVTYGNQSAVVEDVYFDRLPLPLASLLEDSGVREFVLDTVREAEEVRMALVHLASDVTRAAGGDPPPWDRGTHPSEVFVQACDPVVRRLLAGLQKEPERTDDARVGWRSCARRLALDTAESVLDAAPPTTVLGRDVNGHVVRLSNAESHFRRHLNQALPWESKEGGDD